MPNNKRRRSTLIPPEGIGEHFRYDQESGLFFHLRCGEPRFGNVRPGQVAGSLKDGYINLAFENTLYRAHRVAWYIMTGDWLHPSQDIDHINGVRSDNRWTNLRLATRSQNNMNLPLRKDNKSGHKGVFQRKDTLKWAARIRLSGKIILLGHYDSMEDAVAARRSAEERLFGERSFAARGTQQRSL